MFFLGPLTILLLHQAEELARKDALVKAQGEVRDSSPFL